MKTRQIVHAASPAAIATVAALLAPGLAMADAGPGDYGYGYGHMMWGGWGGMLFGGGLMVLFVIAVVIILVRALGGGDGPSSRPVSNPGLDVLNERYARGEIDTAEYNERKKHIMSGD